MPREEATNEELMELCRTYYDESYDLNGVEEIILGKMLLWLRSFGCPDSLQATTSYAMMNDIYETLQEFGFISD